MAGFRKAKAEQAALKIGLYGPPGSGKTFTSLLVAEGLAKLHGKRIAYVDTERGTDFYSQAVKSRALHPEAFDFDALYTRSLTEMLAAVKGLSPDEYCVVVLDSVTHAWEAAIAAYNGKQTKIGTIPFNAWGRIKKPYKDLMAYLLASPMHVLICGRQKTVYEENEETEEIQAVGVTMRAEGETPYEPHILLRMEAVRPKHTQEQGKVIAYAEKDRTGVLSGRSFTNPTFDSLCKPLLGLLGSVQAQMATGDETAALDAERLVEEETARAEASTALAKDWAARITLTKSHAELKAVGNALTKEEKAKMIPADVANLREAYQAREKELGQQAAA